MENYNKRYYKKNKESEKVRIREYCKNHPEKVKDWDKARYLRDKEKRIKTVKIYAEKNKDKVKAYQKAYRQKKKLEAKEYHKRYRAENKDNLNKKYLEKLHRDPLKRLIRNMRSGLSRCLSGKTKGKFRHLNYSVTELRNHIESLFQLGMTWENYGRWGWHVDHKIPLQFKKEDGSYYWNQENITNPKSTEFKEAWSLFNLKPMWACDNISKSNRFKED